MDEIRIIMDEDIDRGEIFGTLDAYVNVINDAFNVVIHQRDNELIISGEQSDKAHVVFQELVGILRTEASLDIQKVNYVIDLAQKGIS